MMNDLAVTNLDLWKYVDDITGSEITGKEAISQANMAVNEIYIYIATIGLSIIK